MKFDNNEVFKNKISVFVLIILLKLVNSQFYSCKDKTGCLLRTKFFSYVSFQSQDGSPRNHKSSLDNKIIYLYTDRLVFYTSDFPVETDIEIEKRDEVPKLVDESKIERIIYFSEIILDCGKFNNNLCHAISYPQIRSIKTYDLIERKIPFMPDVKCIVVPFFESSYQVIHDKVAFICIEDFRLLLNLIEFKHTLSRAIESYQFKLGNDRFNSFNGIERMKMPFIYFNEKGKGINVIAMLYGKKINLIKNDKYTIPIRTISLYQYYKLKCLIVKKALEKKLISEHWKDDFGMKPYDDCCIVFPDQKDEIFLCAVSNDERTLERAGDICQYKLKLFINAVKIQSHTIELAENNEKILRNRIKPSKCEGKLFYLYNIRIIEALKYAALTDCKMIFSYGKGKDEEKLRKCQKLYLDESKLEIQLLSGGQTPIYNQIYNCVNNNKLIKPMLMLSYLNSKV